MDLRDARALEPLRDHRAQVEHAPVRDLVEVLELGQHLGTHLVATATDAGADGGGRHPFEAGEGRLEDAGGERPPAAVQHRDAPAVRKCHRVAVRHQHEQAEPRLGRDMSVDARQLPSARIGERPIRRRLRPLEDVAAVHLPTHRDALGRDAGRVGHEPPVLGNGGRVVVGESAEVERPVRPAAHAAVAAREEHVRPRQLERPAPFSHRRAPLPAAARSRAPDRGRARGRRACATVSRSARGRARVPRGRPRRAGPRR